MVNFKKMGMVVLSCVLLLGSGMKVSAEEVRNECESYTVGEFTYSVIAYTPAHVEMRPIRNDSWVKALTFVGYPGSGAEMYCTCTVGLEDGVTGNYDYMWTGQNNSLRRCDVATGIYVNGRVKNSAGDEVSAGSYITNSQSAPRLQVEHKDAGSPTFYVTFRG